MKALEEAEEAASTIRIAAEAVPNHTIISSITISISSRTTGVVVESKQPPMCFSFQSLSPKLSLC